MYIEARNLNRAFDKLGLEIFESGKPVGPRGMQTLELHPAFVCINNPTERYLSKLKRGNNIFHTIYETLWVFAGRSDVEALAYYLPRAIEFSDDGKTWRGGYGPRLFRWGEGTYGSKAENQLRNVVDYFKKDIETRHAVIEIWDPYLDTPYLKTKDRPCSNYLHFMVRDGALDLLVIMRSNDLWWGFSSVNVFEWSFLQEIIALSIEQPVGKLYYLADSLHVYEKIVPNLMRLLGTPQVDMYIDPKIVPNKIGISIADVPGFLQEFLGKIDAFNRGEKIDDLWGERTSLPGFVCDAWFALLSYKLFKDGRIVEAIQNITKINATDMQAACLEYMFRNDNVKLNKLGLSAILLSIQETYGIAKDFILKEHNYE